MPHPWPVSPSGCLLGDDAPGSIVLIGYLLSSTRDGTEISACSRALAEAGCERIVEERQDAMSDCTHSELQTLLHRLRRGDTLVVPHLRSLGSSLAEIVRHVQTLMAAGAGLRV